MILLTIILALGLSHYRAPMTSLQNDRWFFTWLAKVSGWTLLAKIPAGRLLLSLALPVVGLWLLLDILADIPVLLLLAIELWVLLYSFGRGDLPVELNTLQSDLRRGDRQAAFHVGEQLSADKSKMVAFDLPALAQELRQRVAYAHFERYLAVIFWCLVGGVTAALLYRLSVLYRSALVQSLDRSVEGESSFSEYLQLRTASAWLCLLEWLPLGFNGLVLSLVGQFGAGLSRLTSRWCSGRGSAQVLQDFVDDALAYPRDSEARSKADIAASCEQIAGLFQRVLVCWLCLLALGLIL
ncbi:hypothetical protein A9Q89_09350 [Gammaproteobacteria bacterium 53_120_T64]|nr:hypothetical protein A9Q89_09350 [Gammaproteobacteria bacterium 53_120_T64]